MARSAPSIHALYGDGTSGSYGENLSIAGTTSMAKLATASQGLALGAVASSGGACSPNGTIATDASRTLYICQGLVWTQVGGGGLGYGQNWVDVTATRSAGVTYENTENKPIAVSITISSTPYAVGIIYVNGVSAGITGSYTSSVNPYLSAIVPAGSTYSVQLNYGYASLWAELR